MPRYPGAASKSQGPGKAAARRAPSAPRRLVQESLGGLRGEDAQPTGSGPLGHAAAWAGSAAPTTVQGGASQSRRRAVRPSESKRSMRPPGPRPQAAAVAEKEEWPEATSHCGQGFVVSELLSRWMLGCWDVHHTCRVCWTVGEYGEILARLCVRGLINQIVCSMKESASGPLSLCVSLAPLAFSSHFSGDVQRIAYGAMKVATILQFCGSHLRVCQNPPLHQRHLCMPLHSGRIPCRSRRMRCRRPV